MKQHRKWLVSLGLVAACAVLSQTAAADGTTAAGAPQRAERSPAFKLSLEQMDKVRGGIWDYSNRLGILGQQLEDAQDRNYGDPFGPKTLDQAAHQALEGWVSVP
jgi:hypothetical protein